MIFPPGEDLEYTVLGVEKSGAGVEETNRAPFFRADWCGVDGPDEVWIDPLT